ncbi:5380_t:CDS:1, partial [Funneliformis geosporum]
GCNAIELATKAVRTPNHISRTKNISLYSSKGEKHNDKKTPSW